MAAAVTEPRGKRVLSGTQPTGVLHLGNYFGSIRQKVRLQQHNQGCYFIADLHSMNEVRDGGARRGFSHELALDFLALGLDPERSVLYRQSDLPEVAELSWILTTVTPMGLLQRAHSYKDALASGEKPDHGLLAYPVLKSADIPSNSSGIQPTPTPKSTRPPERTSRVVIILAFRTGCLKGSTRTLKPSLILVVAPPTKLRAVTGSSTFCPRGSSRPGPHLSGWRAGRLVG